MKFNGQAAQDYFVMKCLNFKRNGTFLEIGSNDPIHINNSYLLEKEYGWTGYMIEYEPKYLPLYELNRPNSKYIINDATQVDYREISKTMPTNIDYLQIDLEVDNESTIQTLRKINNEMMDNHKFATVTFEHDIYTGNHFNTRFESRRIFENRGYVRVFSDISDWEGKNPFEDWYVHPDLVNMDYINSVKTERSLSYLSVVNILDF